MSGALPEPVVTAELIVFAVLYVHATTRVRRWDGLRTLCWLGGLAAIAVALGPLDGPAEEHLPAHMAQHLVLILAAPPLLLLGAPVTLLLAVLPTAAGRSFARLGRSRGARILLAPPLTVTLFAATILTVHLPVVYEAALADPMLHALEHVAFLTAGCALWAPLLAAAPVRRRLGPLSSILYLMFAALPGALVGIWLTTAGAPVYPSYAAAGRAAALDGQRTAGMLMWVAGSAVLSTAIVVLGWRGLQREERRQQIREAHELRLHPAEHLGGGGPL